MTSAQQLATLASSNCEIAFDNLTRQLYATDASLYQIEPVAVGFPKNTRQASALVQAAAQAGVSVIPRGAGTGLAGGAIGDGLVIDFSRYNNQIMEIDQERRMVRVGPGVVLDQLNRFLEPLGFCFGPDVATSSRATLGGMIANNSSGARTPLYGCTADHVHELEVVMADGRVAMVGTGHDTLRKQRELMGDVASFHALEIEERMPPGLLKRWPGYALDRCLKEPENLNHLLCGSEGTLAAITAAELKIVPLPKQKGLGLIFFSSIGDAMQATVELLDLKPAAIEHMDRVLLDQTRGQREFRAARDLLDLDHKPCEAVLVVEFFGNVDQALAALTKRRIGMRCKALKNPYEIGLVLALRKAGLNLLTGCKGPAKPVTGIEDAAVRPAQLPAYVEALQGIMTRLGLEASFYGHAAAGLLHVRPVLDLHSHDGLRKFREVASEVSALVRQFKGSLAGEHGVGIARAEFMVEQLGEDLVGVMREIKASFDPHHLFNPGKVLPEGDFKIDTRLRINPGRELKLPFTPRLAFAAKDGSFIANLEQCNGCGGCRKDVPSMCPTFIATGQEVMSTRGRANFIRAILEGRDGGAPGASGISSPDLASVLDNCLSCKACTVECPSNVNLSLLKAELQHGRIQQGGLSLSQRIFSSIDELGAIGCAVPWLANWALESIILRRVLSRVLGLAWQRALPEYTSQRFDRWFSQRQPSATPAPRGRVMLWDDTYARYHEPRIGMAAVKVLETAGYEVVLPVGRKCCGRPAFSQGHLEKAAQLGAHNIALLSRDGDSIPIVFLEPSCFSMFAQDYRELGLEGAEAVAARCFLFEEFIENLLNHEPEALKFKAAPGKILIHAHCHVRGMMNPLFLQHLAARLPQRSAKVLDAGCCGMAGAFGARESKYELSLKVAEPLIQQLRGQPYGTLVVASGTSCRHQINHLAPIRARHMAEVLAEHIES